MGPTKECSVAEFYLVAGGLWAVVVMMVGMMVLLEMVVLVVISSVGL